MLSLVLLAGCQGEPATIDEAQYAELKARIKSEVLAELRTEIQRARRTAPAPGPSLSAGERAAIAEARSRNGAPPAIDRAIATQPAPRPDTQASNVAEASAPEEAPPVEADAQADAEAATAAADTSAASDDGRVLREGVRVWAGKGELQLVDLAIGTSISNRIPQQVSASYAVMPQQFFCYTVFNNPDPDATVTHIWRRGTRLVSRVELRVGKSKGWRTWSRQRTRDNWQGPWSCEVLGTSGERIGLAEFNVGG